MSMQDLELAQGINETKSRQYYEYFRTKQTARNTSVMAPPAFRQSYFVGVSFCRMSCQVLSERIEIDSVSATTTEATTYLRSILEAIGGSDFVNAAHLTAMEYGRAYLIPTGTDRPDGLPGVQVVPGRDMVHAVDPYTGEIIEALRVYGRNRDKRAYYTAVSTLYMEPTSDGWVVVREVPTATGKIAVFPLICRGEVDNPWGRPEAKDAFTLQDAACRIATDLSIASATLAVPQRAILGSEEEDWAPKNADGSPKLDADGNPLPGPAADNLYMSRLLLISDPGAKLAEFAAAQLQNFTTALNAITRQAAAVLAVPQSVFGVASDANPASGDAIRQDDARLVRRSEQITRGFEPAWIGLFNYLLSDSVYPNETAKVSWVDPSLPNLATRSDAILKLATVTVNGRPLYTWEELRHKLGDPQEEIDEAQADYEKDQINKALLQPDIPTPPVPAPPVLQPVA